VDIALPALAGFEVVFEIRVSGNGTKVIERRTAEIRMQNHACGIDHMAQ